MKFYFGSSPSSSFLNVDQIQILVSKKILFWGKYFPSRSVDLIKIDDNGLKQFRYKGGNNNLLQYNLTCLLPLAYCKNLWF